MHLATRSGSVRPDRLVHQGGYRHELDVLWKEAAQREQSAEADEAELRRAILGGRRPCYEQLEGRNMLAVLTVNSFADNTTPGDNLVTLREAVLAANANTATDLAETGAGADVIRFDPAVFGVAHTIPLGSEIPISESLTILGPGQDKLTIDAADLSRIFSISAGDVSIKGLVISNGSTLANGGAIDSSTLGMLSIADAKITSSAATNGGAISSTGDLLLTNVVIGGTGTDINTATSAGGGIFAQGNVILKNTVIAGNTAGASGGGIEAQFSTVSLQNSTIDGNTAAVRGGGIDASIVMAQNSTISNNTATASTGGGIDAVMAVLKNSTVFNNTATVGSGGGVRATNVILQNATIAENNAPLGMGGGIFADMSLNVQNSIIASNHTLLTTQFPDVRPPGGILPTAGNPIRNSLIGESGTIPSAGDYLVTGPAAPNAAGNFIGNSAATNPITGIEAFGAAGAVLADNGGATKTVNITGSIAVNKGSNALAVSPSLGDQRGPAFARISEFGGTVDMGAFEVQTATAGNNAPVKVTDIVTPQSVTVGNAFNLNVAGNFSDPDSDALTFSAVRVDSGVPQPPGSLPDWLTFNQSTGVFTGVPTASDVGQIQIQVTATDNKSVTPPPLPSSTFTLDIVAAPTPVAVELPVAVDFETVPAPPQIASDPRLKEKSGTFVTSTTSPLTGVGSLVATRPTVGSRPVATLDFNNPATAATVTNVAVTASPGGGNGSSLWSNAVIVFDFVDANNYKYAGVFEIIDQLVIGQVVNGVRQPLKRQPFPSAANDSVPLNLMINRASGAVTLTSGTTSVSHTFPEYRHGNRGRRHDQRQCPVRFAASQLTTGESESWQVAGVSRRSESRNSQR